MTPPIAAVDGSPTWRRGIRAALDELGFTSVDYPALADWRPGEGGAAVVVWIDDDGGLEARTDFADRWPLIPLVWHAGPVDDTLLRQARAWMIGEPAVARRGPS